MRLGNKTQVRITAVDNMPFKAYQYDNRVNRQPGQQVESHTSVEKLNNNTSVLLLNAAANQNKRNS